MSSVPPPFQTPTSVDQTIDGSRIQITTEGFDLSEGNHPLYGSDDLAFEDHYSNIDFYANLIPQPQHQENALPINLTRERSGITSDHDSNRILVCDRPNCTAMGPFLNQSELRRHQGKHTRPHPCKVASCTVKPFADRAGLIRHGREVHGLKADGSPAPEFRCLVPGCQRGRKGFSRQHNLAQHHRRMHRRPVDEGGLQLSLPGIEGEGALDDMSEVEELKGPKTTESTPVAQGESNYASTHSGQQLPNRGTATSIPVLQAELDMLKAQHWMPYACMMIQSRS